jgi:uncharacterized membrane protein SpoIIM required for sporulation/ABC-type transport system involved in multi-copper enzyme maturation permease subunit
MDHTTVNPEPGSVQPTIRQTAADSNYTWRNMISNALVITRREVVDSFRDWRILAPMIVLTFLFPFLANVLAGRWFGFVESYVGDNVDILGGRSIPFLLMVVGFFPISISLVIALETFVGEKERRSLEPLLSTPLTNTELYIGKTLSSMIPPLVASYGGMTFYMILMSLGELNWNPQPALIIQIYLLTTVQALVMITGAVVVSSQATSTRSANLLASFVIIPMTLVIQAESFVMFIAPDADSPTGIASLWLIALGMFIVVLLFLRVGNAIFNREELLGRTIDELNLRGIFRRMWQNVIGVGDDKTPARNLWHWYNAGVWQALTRTRTEMIIAGVWFMIAVIGGVWAGQLENLQLPIPDVDSIESSRLSLFLDNGLQSQAMAFIIWNNARVLLLTLVAGAFTFGVLALILTPAVFVIVGYLFTQIYQSGLDVNIFYAGIFIHGWVEIPVIVMATAAAFRLGAILTKPPAGQTVGMAWMSTFGDVMKIYVGVVLPGLVLAGFIEAYITPRAVLAILAG